MVAVSEGEAGFDGRRDQVLTGNDYVGAAMTSLKAARVLEAGQQALAFQMAIAYGLLAVAAEVRLVANEMVAAQAALGSALMEGGALERRLGQMAAAAKDLTKLLRKVQEGDRGGE